MYKLDPKTVGLTIRQCRKNRGMTVEQLANKANVSIKFIGDVERGQKMPSINTFIKIVNALDVSFDYVLSQDVVPQSLKLYLFTDLFLHAANITCSLLKYIKNPSRIIKIFLNRNYRLIMLTIGWL